MEFRILEEQEINNAAGLARYVFDNSLRARMQFPQTCVFVEEYLDASHLLQMVRDGELVMWGAFEDEQMVGVSGLQKDGLITILYMLTQYAGKTGGTKLLREMRSYGKEVLGLERVTLNATPAWTAYYFTKQGFSFVNAKQDMHVPFVPMYADYGKMQIQTHRHIPGWVYAAAIGGCFLFGIVFCCLFMMWYLF